MRHRPQPSTSDFRPLTTVGQLEQAIDASLTQPVFIFKHSVFCGTSAAAHEELGTLIAEGGAGVWFLVDVTAGRTVSNAIAERFQLRHESPQLLLIASGQLRWSASHYRVSADRARTALIQVTTT